MKESEERAGGQARSVGAATHTRQPVSGREDWGPALTISNLVCPLLV